MLLNLFSQIATLFPPTVTFIFFLLLIHWMPVTGITFHIICSNFLETLGKYLNCLLAASLEQLTEFPVRASLKTQLLDSSLRQEAPAKSGNHFLKPLETPLLRNSKCRGESYNNRSFQKVLLFIACKEENL